MKDKSPDPPREDRPTPGPLAPPQPPNAPDSGTTQEMVRAEILAYLEKMYKKDGQKDGQPR